MSARPCGARRSGCIDRDARQGPEYGRARWRAGAALGAGQSMALFVPRADPADDLAERDAGRHDDALQLGRGRWSSGLTTPAMASFEMWV